MLSNADNGIVRVGVALTNMVKGNVSDAPTPPRLYLALASRVRLSLLPTRRGGGPCRKNSIQR